jgi:hypothetical protein
MSSFTSKIERLKWQLRSGRNMAETAQSIAEDVARLPEFVMQDAILQSLVKRCTPAELASLNPSELNHIRDGLAPLADRAGRERPGTLQGQHPQSLWAESG